VLACCGAITDYMDFQPFAKKVISSFDRQFLLYEATVLAFSIAIIGRGGLEANLKLERIAEELGAGKKLPHELENASTYSQEFASRSAALLEKARKEGKKMEHFAYIKTSESSTGNVAYSLVGAFDVPVGLAFREDGPDHYEISLRSIDASEYDLGKIIGRISSSLGASGGGHSHAAGCRIERSQLDEFVKMLDRELSAVP
jgi:single-stranded DNA-specific DHH superfamily exonuclease